MLKYLYTYVIHTCECAHRHTQHIIGQSPLNLRLKKLYLVPPSPPSVNKQKERRQWSPLKTKLVTEKIRYEVKSLLPKQKEQHRNRNHKEKKRFGGLIWDLSETNRHSRWRI